MSISLTILGCGSATPTTKHHPTAQFLEIAERFFLIDCGEGTQLQLRRFKLKFSKIDRILISHMHGDHYFGLIGLLSSFHLLGRKKKMTIIGPPDLERLLNLQFDLSGTRPVFPIEFIHTQTGERRLVWEDRRVEVWSFPLRHSIQTTGFLFREKRKPRKINRPACDRFEVPISAFNGIKEGKDFVTASGEVIPNETLTFDPPTPRTYAFLSDTAFSPENIPFLKEVDLMYHESTFLKGDRALAERTVHSTTEDAAKMASGSKAGQLLIGHFSHRYEDETEYLREAEAIFPNTTLAHEGLRVTIE